MRVVGCVASHRQAGHPSAAASALCDPPRLSATKGPMWGHSRFVLGAIGSFLEPFCGHLLPKVDKLCSKLTFEIPPRRALRGQAAPLALRYAPHPLPSLGPAQTHGKRSAFLLRQITRLPPRSTFESMSQCVSSIVCCHSTLACRVDDLVRHNVFTNQI